MNFLRLGDLYTINIKYNNAYFQNISGSFSHAFFNVWKTLEQLKDKNRKGLLRIQNIKYKFKYLPHYQVAIACIQHNLHTLKRFVL